MTYFVKNDFMIFPWSLGSSKTGPPALKPWRVYDQKSFVSTNKSLLFDQ
jgi:hypothetical protein